MRRLFLAAFLTLSAFTIYANDFYQKTDAFLKKHVSNGLIDYKAIQSNPAELNELVSIIGSTNTDALKGNDRKAFLINTYNILVIKNVIDNYPINSPVSVSGFFDGIKFNIGGKNIDLNVLENKILRPEFKDPRLHFVLVCGAISCPPITDFAYTPDELDKQLDKQTTAAMNNDGFIQVDDKAQKAQLSEIFKWYAEDFKLEAKSNVEYINKYRLKEIPSSYKTGYYTYNWTLNEKSLGNVVSSGATDGDNKSVIQTLTPSALLKKKQWDVSVFNNLYSQTNTANQDGEISTDGSRSSFFTSTIRFNYGVSKNARINVGVVGTLKSTRYHEQRTDSPAEVLEFKNSDDEARFGFSSIAPAIKFTPFKSMSNLSIQSSLSIPLVDKNEGEFGTGKIWLDRNSYFFNNQIFFDKSFYHDYFQIFAELDLGYNFEGQDEGFFDNSLSTPLSVFFSYFPTSKITFYVQGQHAPTWWINDEENQTPYQDFSQYGIGGKYQLTDNLNIELLFSDFFRGVNSGLGETYNLGLRYVFL